MLVMNVHYIGVSAKVQYVNVHAVKNNNNTLVIIQISAVVNVVCYY